MHLFTVQTYLCRRETGDLGGLEGRSARSPRTTRRSPRWRCLLATLLVETGRADEAHGIVDVLAPDDFVAVRRDFNYPASPLALLAEVDGPLGDDRARRDATA